MDRVIAGMHDALARASSDEAGAAMAEWVLVVFLIAILAISALTTIGGSLVAKLMEYVSSA